jgi:hypothetical protein
MVSTGEATRLHSPEQQAGLGRAPKMHVEATKLATTLYWWGKCVTSDGASLPNTMARLGQSP